MHLGAAALVAFVVSLAVPAPGSLVRVAAAPGDPAAHAPAAEERTPAAEAPPAAGSAAAPPAGRTTTQDGARRRRQPSRPAHRQPAFGLRR